MTEVEVVTKFSEQVRLFGLRRTIHARWVQWWGNRRRAAVADTVTGWCGEFFPHRLCQNTNIGCTCICHEERAVKCRCGQYRVQA